MVKGIQKRMVEVKLKNSKLYESACLVMRSDTADIPSRGGELLDEANRIISALELTKSSARKSSGTGKIITGALLLLLGIIIGFAIGVLV